MSHGFMRELFSGENGRLSSKRIFGAIALLFALVLTVLVVLFNFDAGVLMYPYATSGGLLGIGVLEKTQKKG